MVIQKRTAATPSHPPMWATTHVPDVMWNLCDLMVRWGGSAGFCEGWRTEAMLPLPREGKGEIGARTCGNITEEEIWSRINDWFGAAGWVRGAERETEGACGRLKSPLQVSWKSTCNLRGSYQRSSRLSFPQHVSQDSTACMFYQSIVHSNTLEDAVDLMFKNAARCLAPRVPSALSDVDVIQVS